MGEKSRALGVRSILETKRSEFQAVCHDHQLLCKDLGTMRTEIRPLSGIGSFGGL